MPDVRGRSGSLHSHGICEACARTLLEELSIPIDEFLSEIGVPVMLMSEDVRVLDVNPAGEAMLSAQRGALVGRLGGEVFECENAKLPGGCGRSVHCSGCVLRQTITSTWRTGSSHTRVPATLTVKTADQPSEIAFFVTTAKVGDRVLLRIDPRKRAPDAEGRSPQGES